jgi:iron complex outermembrane receptor protein
VQVQHRDFTPSGDEMFLPQSRHRAVAGFLFEKGDFDALHADLGLRYETNQAHTTIGGRAEFGVWSLSGGLNFGYREEGAIGASLTYAERAPALEELFARGPHLASRSFEIGDPTLRPEQAVNLELTLHEHFGPVTLQINGFHNAIDDFVHLGEQDSDGDGLADRVEPDYLDTGLLLLHQTQRDARFWGYEAELRTTFPAIAAGALQARLWTDYVRGRLQGGLRLARLTPRRIGFELGYDRNRFTADASVTRVFAKSAVADLETPTDGYTMVDVGAGYTFDPAGPVTWQLSLRASNLLDAEARRHTSLLKDEAPLPGRAVRFGVSMVF